MRMQVFPMCRKHLLMALPPLRQGEAKSVRKSAASLKVTATNQSPHPHQASPCLRGGGPPLAVEGITYLSTLRSRISSRSDFIHQWWISSERCEDCIPLTRPWRISRAPLAHISRGIPPSVDMLHITCGSAAHITTSKARHITHRRCLPPSSLVLNQGGALYIIRNSWQRYETRII